MEHNNRALNQFDTISDEDDLTFSIKRINASEKITEVTVNFPLIQKTSEHQHPRPEDAEMVVSRSTPAFNNDGNFYTPSFVLDIDLGKVQKSLNSYYAYHQKKVEEMVEEKEQIYVPKPSKNHTFCGICRVRYEDYLEHVTQLTHTEKIKKAKFDKNVDKFVKVLQKKDKRIFKQKKPEVTPARRGRPPKKQQAKPQTTAQAPIIPIVRTLSTEPEQPIQSNQSPETAKRELETFTPQLNENVSWVGQFLA